MWQRFTERARKAVFYAQEEAQRFGEGYVSTEHLLLGLVREPDSVACRVLAKLGIEPERVRAEVEKQLPTGDMRPSQDMTLTPRAKRVIDLAYDEARNLNNNYIGTEHLLLGLIREADGLAGRVLGKMGAELDAARLEVIALQAEAGIRTENGDKVSSRLMSGLFHRKKQAPRSASNLLLLITGAGMSEQLHLFLKSLGLTAIDWDQDVQLSGNPAGVPWKDARQAMLGGVPTLVVFTPDERVGDSEGSDGAMQPRADVLFDAGYALGSDPDGTVFVRIGDCRLPDDDIERRSLALDDGEQSRSKLIARLQQAGLKIDTAKRDWVTAGVFGSPANE